MSNAWKHHVVWVSYWLRNLTSFQQTPHSECSMQESVFSLLCWMNQQQSHYVLSSSGWYPCFNPFLHSIWAGKCTCYDRNKVKISIWWGLWMINLTLSVSAASDIHINGQIFLNNSLYKQFMTTSIFLRTLVRIQYLFGMNLIFINALKLCFSNFSPGSMHVIF